MKIYTSFNKAENFVGVVLLSDKGDIYLKQAFETNAEDNISGNLLGIGRALSFIKNMKPLYAKETVWTYTDMEDVEEKKQYKAEVINNEYCSRFTKELGIKVYAYNGNHLEPDLYFQRIARNEARFANSRAENIRQIQEKLASNTKII